MFLWRGFIDCENTKGIFIMKCFVDIDGCIANFILGCCKLHRYDYDKLMASWPPGGGWDFFEMMGLTASDFYTGQGESFWSNLEWTPDGKQILQVAEDYFGQENVCLLTSPILQAGSYSGKAKWVEKNLPQYKRRLLIGAAKHFCAHPNVVLIDDSDKNIKDFRKEGGIGVTVPRLWNECFVERNNAVEFIKVEIPLQIYSAEGKKKNYEG